MDFELYLEIVLTKDILGTPYKKGDLATIIDIHEDSPKKSYTLEFYNSLGETLSTKIVQEEAITMIPKNTIVCIRDL
ncbi:MAG: DUF4926 domain-containing protein [Leptospiraceae bacterium]|nr:DUF4926 domain-containing protein [Leptospiraceae bacterium]